MNYKEYMTAVKQMLNKMTEQEKTEWIYNKAGTAKKYERDKTLATLAGELNFDIKAYEIL